jgi:hypothetical protein
VGSRPLGRILGTVCGSASTNAVFPLSGGVSNSYQFRARLSTVGNNTGFGVSSHVIVTYWPFDDNPTASSPSTRQP